MIIYCITDGAPTTERGMPTTVTTYKMLEYLDQTLITLKLPRKTIGFNVTQIGIFAPCVAGCLIHVKFLSRI